MITLKNGFEVLRADLRLRGENVVYTSGTVLARWDGPYDKYVTWAVDQNPSYREYDASLGHYFTTLEEAEEDYDERRGVRR